MRPESFRVHAPSTVVFLCGGVIDAKLAVPTMLRDAFFRISKTMPLPYRIVLAEDAEPLTTDAGYDDLFSFESDIAQVVGLILLFVESAGSIAELGAFAALQTVAPSVLAVMSDYHYNQISFIKNGPVKYLESTYSEEWVVQLDCKDVGISDDGRDISKLKQKEFMEALLPAVQNRIAGKTEYEKFDRSNNGHIILLIVGLCQLFGALTQEEIRSHLNAFGVADFRFKSLTYCARLLGWIQRERKGHHIYFVATPGEIALDFIIDHANKEKDRWKADIRAFWRANDTPRRNAISEVIAPVVGAAS